MSTNMTSHVFPHPGVNPKTYTTKCEQYERGNIPPYSNAINALEREYITTL
jgi:hypothetical protein